MDKINIIFENIIKNINSECEYDLFFDYLNTYYNEQIIKNNEINYEESLITNFFEENNFYYCKSSKLYFNYNNIDIIPCNEDNVLYYVLDYISNTKNENSICFDTNKKQIIKNKIMKIIKEKYPITDIIPESETIQQIIHCLVPGIFPHKDYAKFFLISIGDIIMKKNSDEKFIIFTKSKIKNFLCEINRYISMYIINNNIFNVFKFKYTADHEDIKKYMLFSNDINLQFINFSSSFFTNLLCVSIYYSNRYNNTHYYIETYDENYVIKDSLLYFDKNNKQTILNDFKNKYLIYDESQSIYEKDIIFLWKKFNSENDNQINLFINNTDFIVYLFSVCKNIYDENSNKNILHGYYSLDIPNIQHFKNFFNQYFVYDENEFYFELNEILFIFNKHDKHKKHNFNEDLIKEIIQVYYQKYSIVSDKHIHNIKCTLWDKQEEIKNFIKKYNIKKETNNSLYKEYCTSKTKYDLKIGKKYFIQYIKKIKDN